MQKYIGKKLLDDTSRNQDFIINEVLFEDDTVILGKALPEDDDDERSVYFMAYKETGNVFCKELMFYYMEQWRIKYSALDDRS